MRPALLILLLFLCTGSPAQNYRCVDASRSSFYSFSLLYQQNDTRFTSIRIDSSGMIGSDTVLYNYRTFNNDPLNNSCNGLDLKDTNALFEKAIVRNNGENVFPDRYGDSIFLNTMTGLNASFTLVTFGDGSYVRGTVSNIVQQIILGSPDSVKHIVLQKYNVMNNPVSCLLNGKEIRLAKNNGLVLFYPFTDFPNDSTSYRLVGKNNPGMGITNLFASSVYDYGIGDVFEYNGGYNAMTYGHNYYEERIVLSKTVSLNSDTISYTFDHRQYDLWWTPSQSSNYIHDTISAQIVLSSMNDFSSLTGEFVFTPSLPSGSYWQHQSSRYNSRMQKSIFSAYAGFTDTCVQQVVGWCIFPTITYADGLGEVSSIDISSQQCGGDSLVYYKKGNETYGTPLNWSMILGEAPVEGFSTITVFPNPVKDQFILDLGRSFLFPVHFVISDIEGRVIEKGRVVPGQRFAQMDISALSQGLYLIKVDPEGLYRTLKIVKD